MTIQSYLNTDYRHDFVLFFDVQDGNPNGDPDAGNMPRVDPETMQGLVTDVAIKRKVRDWVDAMRGNEGPYKIYVQSGEALNTKHQRAYDALDLKSTGSKQNSQDIDQARAWMCQNFYDIRTFGAVMTTGVNCGQVRGPMQLTFARSHDPIMTLDVTITRVAVTKEEDRQVVVDEEGQSSGKQSEMGRKAIVPYGLYRAHGFYNPYFAEQTGYSSADLELFWQALQHMWDLDRSAARGMMACRGLYVFSHDSKFGKAPAHQLFDRLTVALRDGVEVPRRFSDYQIRLDDDQLPSGVVLNRLLS
jgi:CRISPR-associated protein Csd2